MGTIDFNADLGESFGLWERGADDALMQVISSANVACGFHAGDPATMRVAVETAAHYGVAVGSHPACPTGSGSAAAAWRCRRRTSHDYVLYQTGALRAFAAAAGLRLHHVKPHGALYMMALDDAPLARAIVEAVGRVDDGLPVYTLAGSEVWHAAEAAGVSAPVAEFFADRPMRRDGDVVMFGWQELFEPTPEAVAERVREFVTTGVVTSLEGRRSPSRRRASACTATRRARTASAPPCVPRSRGQGMRSAASCRPMRKQGWSRAASERPGTEEVQQCPTPTRLRRRYSRASNPPQPGVGVSLSVGAFGFSVLDARAGRGARLHPAAASGSSSRSRWGSARSASCSAAIRAAREQRVQPGRSRSCTRGSSSPPG